MQTQVPARSILIQPCWRYRASHRVPLGPCFKNSLFFFFLFQRKKLDFEIRKSVSLNLRERDG